MFYLCVTANETDREGILIEQLFKQEILIDQLFKQEMKDVFRCLADAAERRTNEVMRGRRLVDRHNNVYLVFDENTI